MRDITLVDINEIRNVKETLDQWEIIVTGVFDIYIKYLLYVWHLFINKNKIYILSSFNTLF